MVWIYMVNKFDWIVIFEIENKKYYKHNGRLLDE